jgi:hypothetical protein
MFHDTSESPQNGYQSAFGGCPVESIAHDAEQVLSASPYHQLRNLWCDYSDGTLIIHGNLPTFYLKQQAQIAVKHLAKVARIDNRVVVD